MTAVYLPVAVASVGGAMYGIDSGERAPDPMRGLVDIYHTKLAYMPLGRHYRDYYWPGSL